MFARVNHSLTRHYGNFSLDVANRGEKKKNKEIFWLSRCELLEEEVHTHMFYFNFNFKLLLKSPHKYPILPLFKTPKIEDVASWRKIQTLAKISTESHLSFSESSIILHVLPSMHICSWNFKERLDGITSHNCHNSISKCGEIDVIIKREILMQTSWNDKSLLCFVATFEVQINQTRIKKRVQILEFIEIFTEKVGDDGRAHRLTATTWDLILRHEWMYWGLQVLNGQS